ncbi:MAG: hypothetical protein GXP29_01865 [Planctomycetes bacterium]|nr:hypothetical protein [Planctomycetota bacterium]
MARRSAEKDGGADKGGMRILYVEINGGNATLQEGLRTLVAAINRPVQVAPSAPRQMIADVSPTPTSAEEPEPNTFNQAAEGIDTEQAEQPDSCQNGSTRRKRGEGANCDHNAGLAIVKSLNLHPKGKASLKDFFAKKKPKTQIEKIAVYMYYLKSVLEETNIGISHIFTCFKETGGRMPAALSQTCRNAANSKGWIDTAESNDLKSTTVGDNFVEHTLPRDNNGDDEGDK